MNTAPIRPVDEPIDLEQWRIEARDCRDLVKAAGLPGRWRGRQRFTVLEIGFGTGKGFVSAWAAWQADPGRCSVLHFVAIESRPLTRQLLASLDHGAATAPLAAQLTAAWPPMTWNLHRLCFEGGAVQLLLAFGAVEAWLPQLSLAADAFLLHERALRVTDKTAGSRYFKVIARLAAPEADLAMQSADGAVPSGLAAAGFEAGPVVERSSTGQLLTARYAPRFIPRRPPGRSMSLHGQYDADEPVVIVGAGLAGCAVAFALAEQGCASLLLERQADIALEASGNPAGLFHGVVHASDGRHARFYRAAGLSAQNDVARALADGVGGSMSGLLRLQPGTSDPSNLHATIERLGLPEDYVRALDTDAASALAGVRLPAPAWHFRHGGWVDPRGLCAFYLRAAGRLTELRTGVLVATLRRDGDRWTLLGPGGQVHASAKAVVFANGSGSLASGGAPPWLLQRSRGQLSALATSAWPPDSIPKLPVAGAGYVLPTIDGRVWFGASSHPDDGDTGVALRPDEHRANLDRLATLLGRAPVEPQDFGGRVGFRWTSPDRLPIIGKIPATDAAAAHDRLPWMPRQPGLYVIGALGSRGIASASLGGRVIAAALTGAPAPLEADLLDAVDPGRFSARAARRAQATPNG